MVQDSKKSPLEDVTIKVDSIEEATTTDANGKLTLTNEYKLGAKITISMTKDYYKTGSVTKEIEDNNGENNLVTISLADGKDYEYLKVWKINEKFFTGYTKLESCPTSGDKSVAKYLIKPGFELTEAICKKACWSQDACEYYFYLSGT